MPGFGKVTVFMIVLALLLLMLIGGCNPVDVLGRLGDWFDNDLPVLDDFFGFAVPQPFSTSGMAFFPQDPVFMQN